MRRTNITKREYLDSQEGKVWWDKEVTDEIAPLLNLKDQQQPEKTK